MRSRLTSALPDNLPLSDAISAVTTPSASPRSAFPASKPMFTASEVVISAHAEKSSFESTAPCTSISSPPAAVEMPNEASKLPPVIPPSPETATVPASSNRRTTPLSKGLKHPAILPISSPVAATDRLRTDNTREVRFRMSRAIPAMSAFNPLLPLNDTLKPTSARFPDSSNRRMSILSATSSKPATNGAKSDSDT